MIDEQDKQEPQKLPTHLANKEFPSCPVQSSEPPKPEADVGNQPDESKPAANKGYHTAGQALHPPPCGGFRSKLRGIERCMMKAHP